MNVDQRAERVVALAEHLVLDEIRHFVSIRGWAVTDDQAEVLADAIVAQLLHSFALDWSPGWLKLGDIHAWEEDGSVYARCPICLIDSPASSTENAAKAWVRDHMAAHDESASAGII